MVLLVIQDTYPCDAVIPGYDEVEEFVNEDVIMDEIQAGETGRRGALTRKGWDINSALDHKDYAVG